MNRDELDCDKLREKIRDCAKRHEAKMISDAEYRECVEAERRIFEAHCTEVGELEEVTGERHL